LDQWIGLAVGMKVLVTLNIETDLDLTNGTRGTIVKIVLHHEEEISVAHEVVLKHTPLYVLVRLDHTRAIRLPGLEENVLPIKPASKSYKIAYNVRRCGEEIRRVTQNIKRQQFPITAAYTFTDY